MKLLKVIVVPSSSSSTNKDNGYSVFVLADSYTEAVQLIEETSDMYFMETVNILSIEFIAQVHNPFTQNGLQLLISKHNNVGDYK